MSVRGLDFLVIGAVKAGTTSLHEYLRTHPQLFVPPGKEYAFFSVDEHYETGWDSFSAVPFGRAPADRACGKVTPQYLGGPVVLRPATLDGEGAPAHVIVARRIAERFPDVKLVVLLRDPVDRAISHHWETARWGWDGRSLAGALEEELAPAALASARANPAPGRCAVVAGEYGRLLGGWLEAFDRSQVFVGSAHALDADPAGLLGELWAFLGVDACHVPPNLGVRYNARSYRPRVEALRPARLGRLVKTTPGLRHAWDALPAPTRNRARAGFRRVAYRVNAWNRREGASAPERPDPALLERLRHHYRDDLALLAELVGPVPGVTEGAPAPQAA